MTRFVCLLLGHVPGPIQKVAPELEEAARAWDLGAIQILKRCKQWCARCGKQLH